MALQVWLPLTGNKENQGLKNLSVTNNGATFTNDGKLGKCCHFNGSAQYLQLSETLGNIYSGDFTWALWLKPTDDTRGVLISEYSSAGASNVALELYTNRKLRVYWAGSPDYILTYAPPKNIWTHLAVVKTPNLIRVYANGELVETKAGTLADKTSTAKIRIGDDYRGGTSVSYMGDLNDVRIYDHALTELDIKELYWGKVLEVTPPWKRNGSQMTDFADASGMHTRLTEHNISSSGDTLYFNGSTSYFEFDGFNMSGGSVSMWFNIAAKPTAQRILYCDPSSKMIMGFLSNGNILTSANGGSLASYQTTGITWGQLNHVVAVWNSDRTPAALYINGVQAGTGSTSNWTNSGVIASIGRRIGSGSADYLNGYVNEVKVFSSQLTQDNVNLLYSNGPKENKWNQTRIPMWKNMEIIEESGATWLKVLHHNNPAANLFTTANCKNNEAADLFSKLYLFDDATLLKRHNGTFEFVAKEKTLSTEPEHTFRWTQKSNPTAATVTGYTLVSQTMNPNRSFGLVHQTSRTHFDNKATWWCACGAYSAYNGGIPGFRDVVKSGYIDLYVRIDDTDFLN